MGHLRVIHMWHSDEEQKRCKRERYSSYMHELSNSFNLTAIRTKDSMFPA